MGSTGGPSWEAPLDRLASAWAALGHPAGGDSEILRTTDGEDPLLP